MSTLQDFRKKPVVVEARRFDLDKEPNSLAVWCGGTFTGQYIKIPGRSGHTRAYPGDWIIKTDSGIFGPCNFDLHAALIEATADPQAGIPVEHVSLTFGDALKALKEGKRVARAGWNGKGMWLALSGPLDGREIAFENFWSEPCSEYARANGGSATVLPCINMKTATGEILMGWLASQTDMLAEDWQIVGD